MSDEPSRCRCGHADTAHPDGPCWHAACGCRRFRRSEPTTTPDQIDFELRMRVLTVLLRRLADSDDPAQIRHAAWVGARLVRGLEDVGIEFPAEIRADLPDLEALAERLDPRP